MTEYAPLYVEARRVLLDALQALERHREAIIIAGAQAVYLRTGDAALSVAPHTTDGDVAIDPDRLATEPAIAQVMTEAGFVAAEGGSPGVWIAGAEVEGKPVDIPVDLLVPEAVASAVGRRGARLKGHGKRAARKVSGIEPMLIDNDWMPIPSLSPDDSRVLETRVAGGTALLIAKAHKINDRLEEDANRTRVRDKDAVDVFRLMQTTTFDTVRARLPLVLEDERSRDVAARGLDLLVSLFGRPRDNGTEMAVRSLDGVLPAARIETVCTAFVSQLRDALEAAR